MSAAHRVSDAENVLVSSCRPGHEACAYGTAVRISPVRQQSQQVMMRRPAMRQWAWASPQGVYPARWSRLKGQLTTRVMPVAYEAEELSSMVAVVAACSSAASGWPFVTAPYTADIASPWNW